MKINYTNSNNGKPLFRHKIFTLLFALVMTLPFLGSAQDQYHYRESNLNRSFTSNIEKTGKAVTTTETIELDRDVIWMGATFEVANLGKYGSITITSMEDGGQQTLNAKSVLEWQMRSAYFNGNKFEVTINNPEGEELEVVFGTVKEGLVNKEPIHIAKTQCGSGDDRVDSNDAAVGRLVPVGCTGWIIRNGRLVTAGHCATSGAEMIQFNVPKSSTNSRIVNPDPEDQYPISSIETLYQDSPSVDNDWAVMRAGNNPETGLSPIQAQGKSFNVVQSAPGPNITITGYGIDTGIDSQSQQTHTGPLDSFDSTRIRYSADTTGGNSGSPIIDAATGNALGVHARGGCSTAGGATGTGSNSGTRATVSAFWEAMGLVSTPPPANVNPTVSITSPNNGQSFNEGINITVNLNASDSDGSIQSHDIFINDTRIDAQGVNYSPTVIRNAAPGTYTIRAVVTDDDGATASSSVSITVNEDAPTGRIVQITKRNAPTFAIDGNNGASNNQNVRLFSANKDNVNQQWIEIDRGNGYYSYQKVNTNHCMDGGDGGSLRQNVLLWPCNNNSQNQQWKKQATSGGAFKLIKRNNQNYTIDGGSGGRNNQNVQLWDAAVNHQNLEWFITPIDGGSTTPVSANIAPIGNASQSSTAFGGSASRAIDGNTSGDWNDGSITHTNITSRPHWEVEWNDVYDIDEIKIFNRTNCCSDRLSNFKVFVIDDNVGKVTFEKEYSNLSGASLTINTGGVKGTRVKVRLNGSNYLSLAEVQVFGSRVELAESAEEGVAESVIDDSSLQSKVSIYPNPAIDGFSIMMEGVVENGSAILYNLLGVKKTEIKLQEGDNRIDLQQLSLSPGVYLVKVNNGKTSTMHRVLIK